MIDVRKTYRTRSGLRVVGLEYKPLNSIGAKVTYPISGSIVMREKPLKFEYMIWSEDGLFDVVRGRNSGLDLIEVVDEDSPKALIKMENRHDL